MNARLCAAVLGLSVVAGAQGPAVRPDDQPPIVPVAKAVVRAVVEYADFVGHTAPSASVEIRPRVTGFVQKVAFKEGSIVKQGDLLFEIDARPYRAELDRAEAALVQAETRFRRADADAGRARTLLE